MNVPSEGDYVKIEFNDNTTSPIYGKVIEVREDVNHATNLYFLADYGAPNAEVYFNAGTYEGEDYAWVGKTSQINGDTKIGENGSYSIIELKDIPDDKLEKLMKI